MFVELLDFTPASGDIPLRGDGLPATAMRVAARGGVDVVLARLPAGGRIPAKALREALKEARRTLSDVFLVATNAGGSEWQLVYPGAQAGREVLRRVTIQRGQPRRSAVEALAKIYGEAAGGDVRKALDAAYDVEAVTKRFFQTYKDVFDRVMGLVSGLPDERERRIFCQTLFNRLMFLYFLQRKGWLTVGGDADYLEALWKGYQAEPAGERTGTFYTSRLKVLFFTALNSRYLHDRRVDYADTLIGRVPFLNGGLFAETALDGRPGVGVPDEAIDAILHRLFARFNFTIAESTPYDVEVAVDPEMLGKVFEELVTGRHETGSYYTPRPVVAFMCREALKGYLTARVEGLPAERAAAFVDEHRVVGLTVTQARGILGALEEITVVDPACGSGAYLLGMLHELVDLQRLLYSSALIAGAKELYELKLRVIERNVYGVDIDAFAVNIAMLRLWLSLVVDYEGPGDPPPLPNLDYKIAVGDSLSAPNPSDVDATDLIRHTAGEMAAAIAGLKGEFMRATGDEKRQLHDEIEARQAELRAMLAHSAVPSGALDWRVQFAEVFARGGFDAVLANPPYVRQELIKDLKPVLKAVYGDLYGGTADLYVYFYYRALQLLGRDGMLVFISSNKWFRAAYGAKLRAHIAATCHVASITDFGELPVFEAAATFPMIIVAQKGGGRGITHFTQVKSLAPPYPDVLRLMRQAGQDLPADAIDGDDWLLTDAATALRIRKMEANGVPLGEYAKGQIYRGVLTGFNAAFVISGAKRAELIAQDQRSAEIIKPLATGDDIRKWRVNRRNTWLIFSRRGIDIDAYPAVKAHLAQWQTELEPKPSNWPANRQWQGRKSGSYKWYEIQDDIAYYPTFDKPKIVFPDIAKEPRFTFDTNGLFVNNTTYLISTGDLYLLGVLNSGTVWNYAKVRLSVLGDAEKGGRLRFFSQFVERIPIPNASPADRVAIADLAQKCLDAKGQGPDVAAWEAEIDARVARLYGLSEAEVAGMGDGGAGAANEDDEVATA